MKPSAEAPICYSIKSGILMWTFEPFFVTFMSSDRLSRKYKNCFSFELVRSEKYQKLSNYRQIVKINRKVVAGDCYSGAVDIDHEKLLRCFSIRIDARHENIALEMHSTRNSISPFFTLSIFVWRVFSLPPPTTDLSSVALFIYGIKYATGIKINWINKVESAAWAFHKILYGIFQRFRL